MEVELLAFRTELDIVLPALLARGLNEQYECCVYLRPSGIRSILSLSNVREKLREGIGVLAFEYRGMGKLAIARS